MIVNENLQAKQTTSIKNNYLYALSQAVNTAVNTAFYTAFAQFGRHGVFLYANKHGNLAIPCLLDVRKLGTLLK